MRCRGEGERWARLLLWLCLPVCCLVAAELKPAAVAALIDISTGAEVMLERPGAAPAPAEVGLALRANDRLRATGPVRVTLLYEGAGAATLEFTEGHLEQVVGEKPAAPPSGGLLASLSKSLRSVFGGAEAPAEPRGAVEAGYILGRLSVDDTPTKKPVQQGGEQPRGDGDLDDGAPSKSQDRVAPPQPVAPSSAGITEVPSDGNPAGAEDLDGPTISESPRGGRGDKAARGGNLAGAAPGAADRLEPEEASSKGRTVHPQETVGTAPTEAVPGPPRPATRAGPPNKAAAAAGPRDPAGASPGTPDTDQRLPVASVRPPDPAGAESVVARVPPPPAQRPSTAALLAPPRIAGLPAPEELAGWRYVPDAGAAALAKTIAELGGDLPALEAAWSALPAAPGAAARVRVDVRADGTRGWALTFEKLTGAQLAKVREVERRLTGADAAAGSRLALARWLESRGLAYAALFQYRALLGERASGGRVPAAFGAVARHAAALAVMLGDRDTARILSAPVSR